MTTNTLAPETFDLSIENGVATITLNRPERLNAIGPQLGLNGLQLRLMALQLAAEIIDGREQGCNVLALRFRSADTLRTRVALVAQVLGLNLQNLAPFFQREVTLRVKVKTATRQVACYVRSCLSK